MKKVSMWCVQWCMCMCVCVRVCVWYGVGVTVEGEHEKNFLSEETLLYVDQDCSEISYDRGEISLFPALKSIYLYTKRQNKGQ